MFLQVLGKKWEKGENGGRNGADREAAWMTCESKGKSSLDCDGSLHSCDKHIQWDALHWMMSSTFDRPINGAPMKKMQDLQVSFLPPASPLSILPPSAPLTFYAKNPKQEEGQDPSSGALYQVWGSPWESHHISLVLASIHSPTFMRIYVLTLLLHAIFSLPPMPVPKHKRITSDTVKDGQTAKRKPSAESVAQCSNFNASDPDQYTSWSRTSIWKSNILRPPLPCPSSPPPHPHNLSLTLPLDTADPHVPHLYTTLVTMDLDTTPPPPLTVTLPGRTLCNMGPCSTMPPSTTLLCAT